MFANIRIFGAILLVVAVYSQERKEKCPVLTDFKGCPINLPADECLIDEECGSGNKCCNDGCTMRCITIKKPIQTKKKGKCPVLSDAKEECPINLPADECLIDEECDSGKKCCTDGCTMRCIAIKQTTKICSPAVDLAFIIDASTSIGEENFKMMQPLISKLVNSINIGENGTHVGVIHFSNTAVLQFDFNQFKDAELSKKTVKDEINKISFTGGKSRIDLALKLAKDELFNKKGGMRFNKPKVAVVLTDGNQSITSEFVDLRTASRSLQDIGVHVYVVGVGRNYNILSLLDIASHDAGIYRYVKNYHSKSIVDNIVGKICKN